MLCVDDEVISQRPRAMKTIRPPMELDFEVIDAAFQSGRAYGTFDRELTQFCDFLWGLASALVGAQAGEDLVQKFLLKMSRRGGPSHMGFDPRKGNPKLVGTAQHSSRSFKAWLSTAIWNEAKSYWRTTKRPPHPAPEPDESLTEPDLDDPIINGMSASDVRTAFNSLTVEHREILYLRVWCDTTDEQAALQLGITMWAAKKRFQRADHALRTEIRSIATRVPGSRFKG